MTPIIKIFLADSSTMDPKKITQGLVWDFICHIRPVSSVGYECGASEAKILSKLAPHLGLSAW